MGLETSAQKLDFVNYLLLVVSPVGGETTLCSENQTLFFPRNELLFLLMVVSGTATRVVAVEFQNLIQICGKKSFLVIAAATEW